ncbi:hypothetical protein MMG00_02745 [Ignatzschineria rhizosphaerae]|uniref:Uncharacterized protein n=1 Tax=Ignatzschineria rhizosphaerae TaxID=2923279 RepID=A0ABY3X1N6_9GAMM|nr:hypothetical protein [Ignatzschineria rhizosphaerae]UNM96792.1 hypothetical protein MMG00_02745 [Ignatzschineria rhizosphaerae]
MNNENSSRNKETSVSHNEQLRHLFNSLKVLAFGMLFAGITLLIILYFMDLSPGVELAVLLLFGFAGALYLVGRGKSILLQYHEVNARIESAKEKKE